MSPLVFKLLDIEFLTYTKEEIIVMNRALEREHVCFFKCLSVLVN